MSEQKTEKPTKRRLEKARKDGQFAISREFVSAVQFVGFVYILDSYGFHLLQPLRVFMQQALSTAGTLNVGQTSVRSVYLGMLNDVVRPLALAGVCLTGITLVAQLSMTQLGFSFEKLAPDIARFNPLRKLQQVPQQGFSLAAQSLLLIVFFLVAAYSVASEWLTSFQGLAWRPLAVSLQFVCFRFLGVLWKGAAALLLLGVFDLLRQRRKLDGSLRMTKHEIKQELKESDGNPHIKQRIRKIQRDLARRSMLKDVASATAVVVNPTHYAVAIRFDMAAMAAPTVVAKGRNYIARRIRELATEHEVPIVENPPLAQALFKSTEVGQEIPPHLYKAVAEILAYLLKLMKKGVRV